MHFTLREGIYDSKSTFLYGSKINVLGGIYISNVNVPHTTAYCTQFIHYNVGATCGLNSNANNE